MKKLIIHREKWIRGSRAAEKGKTLLLNSESNMCCLGFHCLQHTLLNKKDISLVSSPEQVSSGKFGNSILIDRHPETKEILYNSDFTQRAIIINDDPYLKEQEREEKLKDLFKTKRYKVVFKGKKEFA